MELSLTTTLAKGMSDALAAAKTALAAEGFGVLTEVDVQATLKAKLGVDYEPYTILGVCNPGLAHRALSARKNIGLFLPCNVIVYGADGAVTVEAMKPTVAMGMIEDPALLAVAREAEEKLTRALASLTR